MVEDDSSLGETLKNALVKLPAEVEVLGQLSGALELLHTGRDFDLLILDRNLPDGDGLALLDVLQEEFYDLRVLLITSLGQQFEVEEGLRSGANDYLTKPFSWNELMLRVRNLLGIRKVSSGKAYRLGDLTFYAYANRLVGEGSEVLLRAKESQLLEYFCQRPNLVINRGDLLKSFWVGEEASDGHIVNVYMQRLRLHLGEQAVLLQTVPKVGYVLKTTH